MGRWAYRPLRDAGSPLAASQTRLGAQLGGRPPGVKLDPFEASLILNRNHHLPKADSRVSPANEGARASGSCGAQARATRPERGGVSPGSRGPRPAPDRARAPLISMKRAQPRGRSGARRGARRGQGGGAGRDGGPS